MAYDVLIEHIIKEGEAEGEQILAEAREKADVLLSDVEKRIEDLRQKGASGLEKELTGYRMQVLNRARLKGNAFMAIVKGEIMDEVYRGVSDALQTMIEGPSYPAILDRLLAEGLDEMRGQVTVERIKGGVEILSEDKRVAVINTLESRWEKAKEELMPEVRKILFDKDDV
ncbi:MAG: hypothetical protein HZA18_04890 [Nitrospirae bacterium]|nr:hypothetical protein [Nitrospirota bacterium]